jgi:hypothetical protein
MKRYNLTVHEMARITQQMMVCSHGYSQAEIAFTAALLSVQKNVPEPIRSALMNHLQLCSGACQPSPALEAAMHLYALCQHGQVRRDDPQVVALVAVLSALRQMAAVRVACGFMTQLAEQIEIVLDLDLAPEARVQAAKNT